MADKIIGSLIYDDHPIPKKSRAFKERIKVPLTIGIVLIFLSGVIYKFANFREEGRVKQFMSAVAGGQYEAAFAQWDAEGGHYNMKEFLQDWGKDGYYTKGMHEAKVVDSNGNNFGVIVYVGIDTLKSPVALLVNKDSLKISFSPKSKYPAP